MWDDDEDILLLDVSTDRPTNTVVGVMSVRDTHPHPLPDGTIVWLLTNEHSTGTVVTYFYIVECCCCCCRHIVALLWETRRAWCGRRSKRETWHSRVVKRGGCYAVVEVLSFSLSLSLSLSLLLLLLLLSSYRFMCVISLLTYPYNGSSREQ